MWDNQSGLVNIIAQESDDLSKTLIGLVSSQNYLFKVRALSVYGYGPFSDTVTIRTSDVPDMMDPVTT